MPSILLCSFNMAQVLNFTLTERPVFFTTIFYQDNDHIIDQYRGFGCYFTGNSGI